jgi:hypothetical protein
LSKRSDSIGTHSAFRQFWRRAKDVLSTNDRDDGVEVPLGAIWISEKPQNTELPARAMLEARLAVPQLISSLNPYLNPGDMGVR